MAVLGYARSEPTWANSALAYAIRHASSAHGHSRPANAGATDACAAHAGPACQHCSSSYRYGCTSDRDPGAAHQDAVTGHGNQHVSAPVRAGWSTYAQGDVGATHRHAGAAHGYASATHSDAGAAQGDAGATDRNRSPADIDPRSSGGHTHGAAGGLGAFDRQRKSVCRRAIRACVGSAGVSCCLLCGTAEEID